MISDFLNERYPTFNIELVVIRAEEAYSTDLLKTLQAYGHTSTSESTQSSHDGVTVDLTKPGK
jgi:hypothetical protein